VTTHPVPPKPGPDPSAKESPAAEAAFFPVTPGTVWQYQLKNSMTEMGKTTTNKAVLTRKIVKSEKVGSGTKVTIESKEDGPGTQTGYARLDPDGLHFSPYHRSDLFLLLKLPSKEGETWKVRYPALFHGGDPVDGTAKVGAPTDVTVPAGKYKATPVEITVQMELAPGLVKKETTTFYVVPQVGVVKVISGSVSEPSRVEELEKFEAAK
jgi:hypothetical protein